jgi:hypothetical protein
MSAGGTGMVKEDSDCELEPGKEPESERECEEDDEPADVFLGRDGCLGWKGRGFRDFVNAS